MLFSLSTIAAVATLMSQVEGAALHDFSERGSTALCNQRNYGASGFPWQVTSTPGSFCGNKKPSNSKLWSSLPYWDGGDYIRCSSWLGKWGYNVCSSSGNKKGSLPKKCNPLHKGRRPGSSSPGKSSSSSTIKSSTTSVGPTSTVASSAAASSAAAASSSDPAAASSAAASSDPSTSTSTSTSSAAAASSSTTDSTGITTGTLPDGTPVYTDPTVDPITSPVCEQSYQVTYSNYTLVAPNGYWFGQTVGAATQDGSYMTYTLALTVGDCLAACDQIEGCVFVNTYYDTNADEAYLPKHTPGVLTCSMYSSCVSTEKNDNWGGQDDPNQIYNSNGYCKSGACS